MRRILFSWVSAFLCIAKGQDGHDDIPTVGVWSINSIYWWNVLWDAYKVYEILLRCPDHYCTQIVPRIRNVYFHACMPMKIPPNSCPIKCTWLSPLVPFLLYQINCAPSKSPLLPPWESHKANFPKSEFPTTENEQRYARADCMGGFCDRGQTPRQMLEGMRGKGRNIL
jgi:hypothetical protein